VPSEGFNGESGEELQERNLLDTEWMYTDVERDDRHGDELGDR